MTQPPPLSAHPRRRRRAAGGWRLGHRFDQVLLAVWERLEAMEQQKRTRLRQLRPDERADLLRLLATAAAALSREMGEGWRERFAADAPITRGEARRALLLAFTALLTVEAVRRDRDAAARAARPPRPRRRCGPPPPPPTPEPQPEPQPEPGPETDAEFERAIEAAMARTASLAGRQPPALAGDGFPRPQRPGLVAELRERDRGPRVLDPWA